MEMEMEMKGEIRDDEGGSSLLKSSKPEEVKASVEHGIAEAAEVSQKFSLGDHEWITQGKTEHHAIIEGVPEAVEYSKPGQKCLWLVKWAVQGGKEWIEVELNSLRPYFQPRMDRRSSKKHKLRETLDVTKQETENGSEKHQEHLATKNIKVQGTVDAKDRRCEYDGCRRRPRFTFEGDLAGRFCAQHKMEGMVDVKNKRCEQAGGSKVPCLAPEGDPKALSRTSFGAVRTEDSHDDLLFSLDPGIFSKCLNSWGKQKSMGKQESPLMKLVVNAPKRYKSGDATQTRQIQGGSSKSLVLTRMEDISDVLLLHPSVVSKCLDSWGHQRAAAETGSSQPVLSSPSVRQKLGDVTQCRNAHGGGSSYFVTTEMEDANVFFSLDPTVFSECLDTWGGHKVAGKRICLMADCCLFASCTFPGEEAGIYCDRHRLSGMERLHNAKPTQVPLRQRRSDTSKRNVHGGSPSLFSSQGKQSQQDQEWRRYIASAMLSIPPNPRKFQGLEKALDICQSLLLRLADVSVQFDGKDQDLELQRQVALAKELSEALLRQIVELIAPDCAVHGCLAPANYGWPGALIAQLCAVHRMEGMRAFEYGVSQQQQAPSSSCGFAKDKSCEDDKPVRSHGQHAMQALMIGRKKCAHGGCTMHPTYNAEGQEWGKFCGQHRLEGMVLVEKGRLCEHPGCRTTASFNFEGAQGRRFCREHKIQGMVNVQRWNCEHPGCSKVAQFNFEGEKRGVFCAQHKELGMVAVVRPKSCEHPGCSEQPHFNFYGERRGRFCEKHKLHRMVSVHIKRCEHSNCSKAPHFNFEGKWARRFCAQHKLQGMVDVGPKKCEQAGCSNPPRYNFADMNMGRFCCQHKMQGMVNLSKKVRRCEQAGCRTTARFNFEGEVGGRFCAQHKADGMVSKANHSRKCKQAGCSTSSCFNFEGEKRGRFCAQHKQQGMVNVVSKRCEHARCSKNSRFNFEGEKRGRFCAQHKQQDMVNVRAKRCEQAGCSTQASFNFEGGGARFCVQHKAQGMVDTSGKSCEHAGCSKSPSFNFEGKKGRRFCAQHKEPGMMDSTFKRCEHAGCIAKKPCFNFEGQQGGRFCGQHKTEGMVDVRSRTKRAAAWPDSTSTRFGEW